MRHFCLFAILIVAPILQADESANFVLCRNGLDGCNQSLLSEEEASYVAALASARNFSACAHGKRVCQIMKLSPQQVATLQEFREQQNAAIVAAILESARNFSACAHDKPTCDQSALTPEQIETLRTLAKQVLASGVPTVSSRDSQIVAIGGMHVTEAQAFERPLLDTSEIAQPSEQVRPPQVSSSRERWQKFGRGLLQVLGAFAQAYVEVESEKANARPIVVSGGGAVVIPPSSGIIVPTASFIESQIDGKFEGWTGETIFKLANGQIWQQSSYAYNYHYAYRPRVYIYRSGNVYYMQVEGVDRSITVVRLR